MEEKLIEYVRSKTNRADINRALSLMDSTRSPLREADQWLYMYIEARIEDYCEDNDMDPCDYDVEEIFEEL